MLRRRPFDVDAARSNDHLELLDRRDMNGESSTSAEQRRASRGSLHRSRILRLVLLAVVLTSCTEAAPASGNREAFDSVVSDQTDHYQLGQQ
jgi:hypothetical protein